MNIRYFKPLTTPQLQAEAARRLGGFAYTQLVCNESIEAWHCAKPGSGIYHFDIMVLRTGMAVTGDMDGMIFNVGMSYGIPFLTHQSKTYVAEKLEYQCRQMKFNRQKFESVIAEQVAHLIWENIFYGEFLDDFNTDGEPVPEWIESQQDGDFDTTYQWVWQALTDKRLASHVGLLERLRGAMEESQRVEDITIDAYRFLHDNETLRFRDVSEFRLEYLDEELIQRLYVLEHAAKAILSIKFPAAQAA